MDFTYLLSESVVTITGTLVHTEDDFEHVQPAPEPVDVVVALSLRGDGSGLRTLAFGDRGADRDFTISLTTDGRLAGATYKSKGVGAVVLGASAKILAAVGGVAVGVAGRGAMLRTLTDARSASATGESSSQDDGEHTLSETPEQRALAAWRGRPGNGDLASQWDGYVTLASRLAAMLLEVRERVAEATEATERLAAAAEARPLQALLDVAREEAERIDSCYRAWRAGTKRERRESVSFEVGASLWIPGGRTTVPDTNNLSGSAEAAFEALGVLVSVTPDEDHAVKPPVVHLPPERSAPEEDRILRWRLPRVVRLTVWKRTAARLVVERSLLERIVDQDSSTSGLTLEGRVFGDDTAELTFDALGVPTKISTNVTSGVGTVAAGLGALPAELAAGLASALSLRDSFNGLRDGSDKRRLDVLNRQLEIANTELSLKGIVATQEDYGRAKRLAQQLEMATAEGSLAPPSALASMELELKLSETATKLSAARREAALAAELGDLRLEVARLTAAEELQKARGRA